MIINRHRKDKGLGSCLTGLGERENLAAEAIVLTNASLPYEIYHMKCPTLNLLEYGKGPGMGYKMGVVMTVVTEEG